MPDLKFRRRRISILFGVIFVSAISAVSCKPPGLFSEYKGRKGGDKSNIPYVSVKVLSEVKEVKYSNDEPFVIVTTYNDSSKEEYFSISKITVKKKGSGLAVYDRNYGRLSKNAVEVYFRQTSGDGVARVNGKGYRGGIYIFPQRGKKNVEVINRLDIDSYLKGVLPAEMGIRDENEYEALKAQAVAARTYALKKAIGRGGMGFLKATISDQVYLGYDSEYPLADKAIEETAGEVLKYDGELIDAYFFAVCGGKTESIDQVWGGDPLQYSKSTDDSDYCAWAKSYFWEDEFPRELAQRRLERYFRGTSGLGLRGKLEDIKVLTRTSSGRVNLLKIYTSKKQYELQGDKIRWAFRKSSDYSKILPSTLFDIDEKFNKFGELESIKFVGRGNGHGIGMCQCGAIGRARRGQNYREILNIYYPGTLIENIY